MNIFISFYKIYWTTERKDHSALSINFVLWKKSYKVHNRVMTDRDPTSPPISQKSIEELDECLPLIADKQANFKHIVDARFDRDSLLGSEVLMWNVILAVIDNLTPLSKATSRNKMKLNKRSMKDQSIVLWTIMLFAFMGPLWKEI